MKILLSVAIFISEITVSAFSPDTMLFTSDFEKNIFRLIEDSASVDSADLFLALDFTPSSHKEKLNRYIASLKSQVAAYPMNKKLKVIYKSTHNEFLSKYNEDAFYKNIFIDGIYNCVTASALYALVFDGLGIDYVIKQTPVHVYLVADPGNTSFLIETTLPGEKMVQLDERSKNNFIQYLHNNKIISDAEYSRYSVDELFEMHYSKDKTISLLQLAGIQYYNKGAAYYNKKDFTNARINFEKALMLYQDDMISYMYNDALINELNAEKQKGIYNGKILAKLINLHDSSSLSYKLGSDLFNAVSHELVINHPNINAYRRYFKELTSNLKTSDTAEVFRTYNYTSAYYYYMNYNYPGALGFLKVAYQINPENYATRELITLSLIKCYLTDKNHDIAIDSLVFYLETFPFLRNDRNITGYLEYCHAATIERALEMDDPERALEYLNRFEKFLYEFNEFDRTRQYVSNVYRTLGWYYFYTNKHDRAEQVMRKGLRIMPDAVELQEALVNLKALRGGSYEYPELMSDRVPIKKYLLAIAIAKDNLTLINENMKYLTGEWKKANDSRFIIMIKEDYTASFQEGDQIRNCHWKYDAAKGIADFDFEKNELSKHMVIKELLPTVLKCVIYEGKNYEASQELILRKE